MVAAEIGTLAEESQKSSQMIDKLITNISNDATTIINTTGELNSELNSQIKIINTAIDSYRNIVSEITNIGEKIQVMNSSANEINDEKKFILERVSDASSVSQEVAASSEEIAASTEQLTASSEQVAISATDLNSMTNNMLEQVEKFKI